jgi:hypothetical protein
MSAVQGRAAVADVKGVRIATWRVFFTCWLVYTVFWNPYIVREHFPALTLFERGTLNVEPYLGWTEDIFRGPKGGAYINNNPGASLVGAVPLVLLRPLLSAVDQWNQRRSPAVLLSDDEPILIRTVAARREIFFLVVAFLTVALAMAPATAFTAAFLCSRLADAGVPKKSAALAGVMYGIGTPVFYRTAHLNHNLLVCDAGITALLLLWDANGAPVSLVRASMVGLLAGFALLCDYSGVVVVAVAGLYVLLRARRGRLLAFCAGLFPMIAALLIYQQWAFGSFYHPSQHFMTPTAPTSHGYKGFDWPSVRLLWANSFDPRFGLFAYCPALLLAFAAPFVKEARFRVPGLEMWILFGYFGLFVLFCASNQYSWFQPLTGFRYLVPVVPALSILAFQTCQVLPLWFKWILGPVTIAQSFIMAFAHQNSLGASVQSMLDRHFELTWMVRMEQLGVKVNWVWPAIVFGLLAASLAWVWVPTKKVVVEVAP